ncbi:MAG TPA: 5'-3' exonuclease [Actinomycetota bacterium]|nr:5'-3' exonuclease [Actinomycetota bacterium]
MTRRVLLDTSSLMYRAFFALPPQIRAADGTPANAVHGYLNWTAALIQSRATGDLIHCYDHDWRPASRVAEYDGYKATRQVDPGNLPDQFAWLREVLDAIGMAQAEAEGWEAEDAIGSIAARARGRDRIDIVTGDRDLLQLVRDPAVTLWFTRKGVTEMDRYDAAAVLAKYGIPPSRYAEFAILRGDPSDELPGVKGIGEKTARELVNAYPDLDALLAAARSDPRAKLTPRIRSALIDSAGYVAAMQRIVPIRTDLEVRVWTPVPDPDRAEELADRYRVGGPLRRIREALDAVGR